MITAEALLVGLVIGAVLGLIGAGGAVVAVPAFLYLFGFAPVEATTASLAIVAASAGSGAIPRLRLRQVVLGRAVLFWVLGVAGTYAGAHVADDLPATALVVGFALVMAGAAVAMWRKSSVVDPGSSVVAGEPSPRWLVVLVALGVGLLTGLFGVGGGFLVVPALVLVFGMPFALATGTSLVVVALNSLTALLFRYQTWEQVSWHIPLLVVLGGLVGSVLASRWNLGVPQWLLERAFAVLLVLLATWMVVESVLLGH